ncbi:hypothetical protein S40288_11441 [Stachybotrys chartarum IBT 40288]|nr:hypothetical protein S40288_11441 [Stachybotrys chartarum IBT 40288]
MELVSNAQSAASAAIGLLGLLSCQCIYLAAPTYFFLEHFCRHCGIRLAVVPWADTALAQIDRELLSRPHPPSPPAGQASSELEIEPARIAAPQTGPQHLIALSPIGPPPTRPITEACVKGFASRYATVQPTTVYEIQHDWTMSFPRAVLDGESKVKLRIHAQRSHDGERRSQARTESATGSLLEPGEVNADHEHREGQRQGAGGGDGAALHQQHRLHPAHAAIRIAQLPHAHRLRVAPVQHGGQGHGAAGLYAVAVVLGAAALGRAERQDGQRGARDEAAGAGGRVRAAGGAGARDGRGVGRRGRQAEDGEAGDVLRRRGGTRGRGGGGVRGAAIRALEQGEAGAGGGRAGRGVGRCERRDVDGGSERTSRWVIGGETGPEPILSSSANTLAMPPA